MCLAGFGGVRYACPVKTKQTLTIRNAEFTDADAIYGLIKAYPKELLARPVSDILQNIDRFLVCEADEKVVGVVAWQILPEIGRTRHPSVEIKSLAVKRTLKGKGLGRRLVASAIDRIKALDPSQIIVLTFTPGFFAKMGFREVPKVSLMHKLYAGCLNCAKYDSPFTCPEVAMAMDM